MYDYVRSAVNFIFETSLLAKLLCCYNSYGFLSDGNYEIQVQNFEYYIASARGDHFSMVGSVFSRKN